MEALSLQNGTCECLGRLKKCSVDAGCDKLMSHEAIEGICSLSGCTAAQCQLAYPHATQCDWDTHTECEFDLQQCLERPNATIVKLYPYNVGVLGLQRWYGDPYHIEKISMQSDANAITTSKKRSRNCLQQRVERLRKSAVMSPRPISLKPSTSTIRHTLRPLRCRHFSYLHTTGAKLV